ncbi:cyclic pyranopterin monophosphate synthase MoaC [Polyangium sp. 15x6]|uniref:cyclic pyranopterin monophosphate synthase MoaC n=1 Tax=Polyangium sp. 15x6 TaxID=3042687 RepID=UPI00249C9675|nr:cyclic pyranopterin monophosphate synthase MoaC [Polyangium sp. 15x6]MDI3283955.1 cyclic pyranopterin monophosphate synthase MoaC [Polyangium sp. 15x6]
MNEVFSFEAEEIGPALDLVPLAARRALDHAGLRLPLEGWRSLAFEERRRITRAGAEAVVDVATVNEIVQQAHPPALPMPLAADPSPDHLPEGLREALPADRSIDARTWASLSGLARFSLVHCLRRAAKRSDPTILSAALDVLVPRAAAHATDATSLSSHLGPRGDVRMVDVAEKPPTQRRAVAVARVRMRPETAARLARGDTPKGEVLATARIAGIMAAKRTPELIPMCHAIALTHVAIALDVDEAAARVSITASAEATDRTGVEMEAMVAASVAALTLYDMLKGIDREMVVEDVMLVEKSGGRSGHFRRSP